MNTWTAIKKLESENGALNVEICVNPDGKLFRFYENAWIEVGEEELLFHPEGGYWTCPKMSGYYASIKECEDAARSDIAWLADNRS
ncbi:hypothetical protein [uncultured Ruegeria sp.]|uniref:hypothetical protein n=1 Tax=uncultured Ruegeria sp. TaxID=259304 RepID=UPI00260ADA8E|nr:hypothetical protein [uncultured Ruegeria sp.]